MMMMGGGEGLIGDGICVLLYSLIFSCSIFVAFFIGWIIYPFGAWAGCICQFTLLVLRYLCIIISEPRKQNAVEWVDIWTECTLWRHAPFFLPLSSMGGF